MALNHKNLKIIYVKLYTTYSKSYSIHMAPQNITIKMLTCNNIGHLYKYICKCMCKQKISLGYRIEKYLVIIIKTDILFVVVYDQIRRIYS